MLVKSKAPLRIGFAGGGTDVSPYSDEFGGAVLNATIDKYATVIIEPKNDGKISFCSIDRNERVTFDSKKYIEPNGKLDLLIGSYNRIVKDFTKKPLSFTMTTNVDAPIGSGLGASSTLVVAIIKAYQEWLKLPLGNYDIANLAYSIEREDLKMLGGKQDQYAASFGGFNFIEFGKDKVIVNPLKIDKIFAKELEFNTILYYTGTSRFSAKIIERQANNAKLKKSSAFEAMHKIKDDAFKMKEIFLANDSNKIGELLNLCWESKKKTANEISNQIIDKIYQTAITAGATGGKISGAGGGGFMIFYCPKLSKYNVIRELSKLGGECSNFRFTYTGAESWTVEE